MKIRSHDLRWALFGGLVTAICGFLGMAALAQESHQSTRPRFKDVPSDHWAAGAVDRLAAAGVFSDDSAVRGNDPATRYEVLAFLDRGLTYQQTQSATLSEVQA